MNLPPKKKKDDPILASDWNKLIDAIAARTPAPGAGLVLSAGTTAGFNYSLPTPLGQLPKGQSPFSVIAIEKGESSQYLVTIKEGWVIERNPPVASHPAVILWMPVYGGVSLNHIPRPQLHVGVNEIAWCRYKCGPTGMINYTPEIVVVAADQPGAHYYPADPEGSGGDGDCYVKLFKLVMDGESPAIEVYQQSDIEHYAVLWTGENVGTGLGVFKKHDETVNIYKFRTLTGDVTLSTDGNEIHVGGNGPTFNVNLLGVQLYTDGEDITFGPTSIVNKWYIRNGRFADPDALVVDEYNIIAQLLGGFDQTPNIFVDNTP